jgi:hypothetical protein
MEKIMPESNVKYYPVLARILMRLGEGSIVAFRGTIVTRAGGLSVDHALMHRIVTEYKGETLCCNMDVPQYFEHYRERALEHLTNRCRKRRLPAGFPPEDSKYEPVTEIVIDLRNVEISSVG